MSNCVTDVKHIHVPALKRQLLPAQPSIVKLTTTIIYIQTLCYKL